jgi:hypothetical protein
VIRRRLQPSARTFEHFALVGPISVDFMPLTPSGRSHPHASCWSINSQMLVTILLLGAPLIAIIARLDRLSATPVFRPDRCSDATVV